MDAPGSGLSKRRLRMWLRMLGVTRSTETALRGYLRENHGTTLPRFEVLAALRRREEPTPMGELSRMLLVSNGNATDVVTRLEKDGLVLRTPCTADRRTVRVRLTEAGRRRFDSMAAGYEAEVSRLFETLDDSDLDAMRTILRRITPRRDAGCGCRGEGAVAERAADAAEDGLREPA